MKALKVFYSPEQTVANNSSFSPSDGNPAKVLASWQGLGLPLDVRAVKPLRAASISLAHDPQYVHDVLNCKRANGFGNTSAEVANSLRYTTASFAQAALYAARNKTVAASLTSGFHHAGYDRGSGFCTFNGLMIAAQLLRLTGAAKRVAIADIDAHFGDGTEDIIKHLGLGNVIEHYTFGSHGATVATGDAWLAKLPGIIESFEGCDVLLYQAGADPWVNDPLGGHLTKEQLSKRDQIVFGVAKEMGLPVAWNLAGGYSTPFQHVLDIHNNSAVNCLATHGIEGFNLSVDDGPTPTPRYSSYVDDHDDDLEGEVVDDGDVA